MKPIARRLILSAADTDGGGVSVSHDTDANEAPVVTNISGSGDAAALVTLTIGTTVVWRKRFAAAFTFSENFGDEGLCREVKDETVTLLISAATTNSEANLSGYTTPA